LLDIIQELGAEPLAAETGFVSALVLCKQG